MRSRQRLSRGQRGPTSVQRLRKKGFPLVIPVVKALAEFLNDRADQEAP